MKIKLSRKEVEKILSNLSLEEINNRKEYNWKYWNVEFDEDGYTLIEYVENKKLEAKKTK